MKSIDPNQFEELKDKSRSGGRDANKKYHSRLANANYRNQLNSDNKKEAVVKVVGHLRDNSVKRALEYVERAGEDIDNQLDMEDDAGRKISKSDLDALYNEWKQDFEPVESSSQRTRHATHLLLSIDAPNNDKSAQAIENAARELLRQKLGDKGYRYAFVVHRDTDNPHVHVIVNNYHLEPDGPKLRLNQPELFQMRTVFAEKLRENGIEQVATFRRDRGKTQDLMAENKALEDTVTNWFASKVKTASLDPEDLKQRQATFREIIKARQVVKQSGRESEASMKALEDLKVLAKSLTLVDLHNSPKSAFSQLKQLDSEKGPYQQLIKAIKSGDKPRKDDKDKNTKRLQWQARKMAFDIAEAELAVKTNQNLSFEEKSRLSTEFSKKMDAVAPFLASGGTEKIRFIVQQRTSPDNEPTAKLAKLIRKLDRSTSTLEDKQKSGELADKQLRRIASDYFTAVESLKNNDLPLWRQQALRDSLQEHRQALSKVTDLVELHQQWNKGQSLKDDMSSLKDSINTLSYKVDKLSLADRHDKIDQLQRQKDTLQSTYQEESYDKKQAFTVSKGLQAAQSDLNDFKGESYKEAKKELSTISNNLDSLSAKQQAGPLAPDAARKAAFQSERIGLRIVQIEKTLQTLDLSHYDQQRFNESLVMLKEKSRAQHVDLDLARKQDSAINQYQKTSIDLATKIQSLKEYTDNRQARMAVQLISELKGKASSDLLPTKERRALVTERKKLDVVANLSDSAKHKVDQYFRLDKQISDLSRFAANVDKKYSSTEHRQKRKNSEYVLGQKSTELQKAIKGSDLPRRLKSELSSKIERSLERYPKLASKSKERELTK